MHKKSIVTVGVVDRIGVDLKKLLELRDSEMVRLECWMMGEN